MVGIHRAGALQEVDHRVLEELAGLNSLMFGREPGEVAQDDALGQPRLAVGIVVVTDRRDHTPPMPSRYVPIASRLRGERLNPVALHGGQGAESRFELRDTVGDLWQKVQTGASAVSLG